MLYLAIRTPDHLPGCLEGAQKDSEVSTSSAVGVEAETLLEDVTGEGDDVGRGRLVVV